MSVSCARQAWENEPANRGAPLVALDDPRVEPKCFLGAGLACLRVAHELRLQQHGKARGRDECVLRAIPVLGLALSQFLPHHRLCLIDTILRLQQHGQLRALLDGIVDRRRLGWRLHKGVNGPGAVGAWPALEQPAQRCDLLFFRLILHHRHGYCRGRKAEAEKVATNRGAEKRTVQIGSVRADFRNEFLGQVLGSL